MFRRPTLPKASPPLPAYSARTLPGWWSLARSRSLAHERTLPRRLATSAALALTALPASAALVALTAAPADAARPAPSPSAYPAQVAYRPSPAHGSRRPRRARTHGPRRPARTHRRVKPRPHPKRPPLRGYAARAQDAYRAMQRVFYLPSARLYRGSPYSYLWPYSQALAATISMAGVPGASRGYRRHVAERLAGLESYWGASRQPPAYEGAVTPPLGPGGQTFYDDNAWVGLELVRLYRTDRQTGHLARAREIFSAIIAAWDADPTHGCPGGIPFSDSPRNDQRNTVTGAPAAELGVRLYELTADRSTLEWAKKMYDWVRDCLAQAGGLYGDHVAPDGTVDATTWSYNQGTMVGAGVLLWRATGQASYLSDATETAEAALIHFDAGRLHREPAFFVSVYFRNLLLLDAVRPDPGYRQALRSYADWAWRRVRQPASGLYTFGPNGTVQLLDQAAMVNLDGLLASSINTYF